MVKQRRGSRKGQMKTTTSGYKTARKRAGRLRKHAHQQQHLIHSSMRSMWDKSKSAQDNLRSIGLCTTVNEVQKREDSTVRVVKLSDVSMEEVTAEGRVVREKLENHANMKDAGTKQVLRPGEKVALQAMYKTHGEDWVKMSRDLKLNYLQWTPRQLEKKVKRMLTILNADSPSS